MARRKQILVESLIDISGKLPWWVSATLALVAYVGLHSLVIHEVAAVAQPGRMGDFVNQTAFRTLASVGQYLLPIVFLLGAGLSAYGRYTRHALHKTVAASPNHAALNDMSWKKFEALVGEAFRRQGYSVTATGGSNGEVDLALKKDGELFLVQCKQW
ncbi:MAG: restriction endonuclease, partial [Burkholderiales bacterium]